VPILEVLGVVKQFGGLTAVDNLSFSLRKGEILGIVGPNGSGKTTTFNMISGFIKPSFGRVVLNGEDITDLKPHVIARKGIARTFQVVRIFRHLSVYENLKAATLLKAKKNESVHEKISEVINLVGLRGKENEEGINLPIGDLKRLEIGRALAIEPQLLLLDEPFSGLSHFEGTEIASLLLDLIKGGLTVVIIEHVLRELKRLAEDIIVLNFGVKIAEGKFEDVMKHKVVRDAYLGGDGSA
jgi:branched-chain amino acid transport system ATP-binding protein